MSRRQCPPGKACRQAAWQNDPVLAVSASGVIYAAWMNQWDVVFAKSRDRGRTWTGLHDFRRALGASFTDKPWIALSPSGRDVYVAFNRSDSYISASHDYGRTWSRPVRTNTGGRYWFAEAGAVAPDGHVYFAESAEHQNAKGTVRLAVISSADGGISWTTTYVARSQQQPRCRVTGCPDDFYGPQISLAIDRAGTVLAAYVANTSPGAPMRLYAITSASGTSWSAPAVLGSRGTAVGADFPKATGRPAPRRLPDRVGRRRQRRPGVGCLVPGHGEPGSFVEPRGPGLRPQIRRALQDRRGLPLSLRRLLRHDRGQPRHQLPDVERGDQLQRSREYLVGPEPLAPALVLARAAQLSSVSQTCVRRAVPAVSWVVRSKRIRAVRPSNSRTESMLSNQGPWVIRHRIAGLRTPARRAGPCRAARPHVRWPPAAPAGTSSAAHCGSASRRPGERRCAGASRPGSPLLRGNYGARPRK